MSIGAPGWCPESAPDRVPLYGNVERTDLDARHF